MKFIDLDSHSVNYGKPIYVNNRRTILDYITKKQLDNIKLVLIQYHTFRNIEIHHDWTLYNAFADICQFNIAEQLLNEVDY